jgi:ribose transport system ATP-binding protein
LDLEVHAGEVVGVAGVTGSGREELAGLVFGAPSRGGRVLVEGRPVPENRPDVSMRQGMAFVPGDRSSNAAFPDMTLRENITISNLRPVYGRAGLKRRAEHSEAVQWLERLDVVPQAPEAIFNTLSGGNQQKVVLARTLRRSPRVLLLEEPTQGVDVGAKASIHQIVLDAAAQGTAVLITSTEAEELVALSDRIVVLHHGHIAYHVAASGTSADRITDYTLRPPATTAFA